MANQTQANTKAAASVVREEDLDDLQEFQKDVEGKVDKAHDEGRIYMMSQYVRILALVSAEEKKIRDRFKRENLASHRSAAKALKMAQREENEKKKSEA